MKKIKFSVKINNKNLLCICGLFQNCIEYGMVAINIKVIGNNGDIYNKMVDKIILISNEHALWSDSIDISSIEEPIYVIIEVHKSGNQVFIDKYSLKKEEKEEFMYYANSNICYRWENDNTISLFNTNGNLLFLRGIYLDLWKLVQLPITHHMIYENLLSIGYKREKIENAISNFIIRKVIIKISSVDFDEI